MSIIIYYNQLKATSNCSDECNVLRASAIDTWNRIGFSRTKPKLKIHETTITQNLVYEIQLLKSAIKGINFRIFESTDESSNGDDLEIKIRNNFGQFITFAVQAKILSHPFIKKGIKVFDDGNYPKMPHTVTDSSGITNNQIDLLLRYAKPKGYIPIYLLYNFVTAKISNQNLCGVSFDKIQYGCSIVSAEYLKKRYFNPASGNLRANIKFSELHPSVALPWFVLSSCFPQYSDSKIFSDLQISQPTYAISKEPEFLFDLKKWRPLDEQFAIDFKNQLNDRKADQLIGFNPKFLITLG